MSRGLLVAALASLSILACSRPSGLFSEANARAHVGMLAGTIGSRAIGTAANVRAREYLVDQLKLAGLDVRVQEADARRPELGATARVANIIATLPGTRREAIGLIAHYDSRPDAPGATDDGLGVAVALEAARVVATRERRQWSLMVILTDGEEAGLMGAAALVTDRDVMSRLSAYLQVESIGSAGPALLFETGPGNRWLVGPWARQAPHPRGGSFATEIYKHLPNDTDFSILSREDIPGLNFAPVGDSYAYHTARDTPERLAPRTIRDTGENVVSILQALDGTDITQRSPDHGTYFDLAGVSGLVYGASLGRFLAIAAIVFGVVAWVRVTATAIRLAGLLRWLLTAVWSGLGLATAFASMTFATWALREAREVYHPWYARPGRLFLLLLVVGALSAWSISRAGRWLPERAHGWRHPLVVWSLALPAWIALAMAGFFLAPSAAYLWGLPLLAAGVALTIVSPRREWAVRGASFLVLVIVAVFWLRDTAILLQFLVATLGRLPIVTPVFIFSALMTLSALMLVPPLLGTFAATRRLLRPSVFTSLALLGLAITATAAYRAPAYTSDAPLRRVVRVLQTPDAPPTWEIGSNEPGLDLAPGAPVGWTPAGAGATPGGVPWGRLPSPFVFRATGASIGLAPARITQATLQAVEGGLELSIAVVPTEPGLSVSFVLPPGVVPSRHNLPGLERSGTWSARYLGVPADGVLFRAAFATTDPARIGQPLVLVTSARLPGGEGWQSLPAWLPQERAVWTATATWA
ncbi:MAG: M28 family peptidase, partial [Vicinamibacterales bacterium]